MNRQKGFTLVEAAVAIGVVAILSGIIIPLILKNVRDARVARARNDLQVIAGAIALQLKDTGTRPRAVAAAAAGQPTGAANAMWFSGGQIPQGPAGPLAALGNQSLANLLSIPANDPRGNLLFGFPPRVAGDEFGYHGSYLARDAAMRIDPWGSAYVVLGYNETGRIVNGPIWVVCAGSSRTIIAANLPAPGAAYPQNWDYAGLSGTNIAIRIH